MNIEKGKPITLPDGSMILPKADSSGSNIVRKDEEPETSDERVFETELSAAMDDPFSNGISSPVKRTLADISVDFQRMNVTMIVMAYTMWGLDTFAISRAMGTTEQAIEAVKSSDIYTRTEQEMVEAFRHAEASTVHGYIASKTLDAAQKIVGSLKSKKEDIRLSAAKDILDRGGFRPVDRVEHVHRFEDELRIRYVEDTSIPTLDLEIN